MLLKHKVLRNMTDEQFSEFCVQKSDLKFERTSDRDIVIMPPAFPIYGDINSEISYQLAKWNKEMKLGRCFDSSTGFTLSNGAIRSSNASFIFNENWNKISKGDKKTFTKICPDFIIECVSNSNSLNYDFERMQEYLKSGCRLGWIIDPEKEQVYIFRPNSKTEIHEGFNSKISAQELLHGFNLDLSELITL
jgi:Uma2 family endonuclease